jgi:hypothetical protein
LFFYFSVVMLVSSSDPQSGQGGASRKILIGSSVVA